MLSESETLIKDFFNGYIDKPSARLSIFIRLISKLKKEGVLTIHSDMEPICKSVVKYLKYQTKKEDINNILFEIIIIQFKVAFNVVFSQISLPKLEDSFSDKSTNDYSDDTYEVAQSELITLEGQDVGQTKFDEEFDKLVGFKK